MNNLVIDEGFYSEVNVSILITKATLMSHLQNHVIISLNGDKTGQEYVEKIEGGIIKKSTDIAGIALKCIKKGQFLHLDPSHRMHEVTGHNPKLEK